MHPLRSWLVSGVFAAFAVNAAVVYKWTDSGGVVHYSDQPVPGAEKIVTAGGPSSGGPVSGPGTYPVPAAAKPSQSGPLHYTQFTITSPTPEQVFFGEEIVNANLSLEPALKPDQTIVWHLNGKQLTDQAANATRITLQGLDRGTYAIAATITDQESGQTQSSDSVTFYVRQPSELSPQHRK